MLRRGAHRSALLVLLSLACLAAGCSRAAPERAKPGSAAAPAPRPACEPGSLSERAGRVVVAGLPHVVDPSDPLVGELMAMPVGGVFLTDSNVQSLPQIRALVDGIRAAAAGPLVVTTDEESGRVSTFADVLGAGPSPRRLAAQSSTTEVREAARRLGAQLSGLGIDSGLSPVLDLDGGPWNGLIGDRSFSADPAVASDYGLAYAQGLVDAKVLPVVKHFPGLGRAGGDTHVRLSTVDTTLEELRASDLVPFRQLIEAGVPVVMLGHVAYTALDPTLPASLSPRAYALLRDLGFDGVAMTDSLGMGAVNRNWDYEKAAVMAIAAGADALLVTDGRQARRLQAALIAAVTMKELDEARLDEAAARVVTLAGGDPLALTCRSVELPQLAPSSLPSG